jgi:hypothetical protein
MGVLLPTPPVWAIPLGFINGLYQAIADLVATSSGVSWDVFKPCTCVLGCGIRVSRTTYRMLVL